MIETVTHEELDSIIEYVHRILEKDTDNLTKWSYPNGYTAENISLPVSRNLELVNLINTKTNYAVNDITSLHYIKYVEGTSLIRHKDDKMLDIQNHKGSVSVVFLLKMCERGGIFILDDVETDFKEPGQFITFDGESTYHEVTEIEKGIRETLVIWYKPKKKKSLF